jgi:hypothetical protein
VPNGIPDAAEFYLLQSILKEIYFDLSERGGVSHDDIWSIWSANLQQAQADLPAEDSPIQNVIAGYMTLGDEGSVLLATRLAQDHCSVALSRDGYDTSARGLAPRGNADADGIPNAGEWNSTAGMEWEDALAAFAVTAKDGVRSVTYNPPNPGEDSNCDGDCINFNNVTAWAWPADGGTATVDPDGYQRRGTEIGASAVPNEAEKYRFRYWMAPGTMIDESKENPDSFPLMDGTPDWGPDTRVCALFVRVWTGVPEDCASFAITGSGLEGRDADGYRGFYTRDDETLHLSATVPEGAPEGTRIWAWTVTFTRPSIDCHYTWGSEVTIAPGGYARPCTTTSAPDPKEEIIAASATASPSNGGRVYCSAITGLWFPWGVFAGGASCPRNWGGYFSFTAVAYDGYVFTDWQDGDGHLQSYATTFNCFEEAVPRGLTAHFIKAEQCTLDLTVTGCGWLDSDKKRKYFAKGEIVKLTAHPASCTCGCVVPSGHSSCCSSLKQWVGTASGRSWTNPFGSLTAINYLGSEEIAVVLDRSTSVTAAFTGAAKPGSNGTWEKTPDICGCGGSYVRYVCPNPICTFSGSDTPGVCPICGKRLVPTKERFTLRDDCKQVLRLICSTQYVLCFDGREISNCEYVPGMNDIRYKKTGNAGKRFAIVRHLNVHGEALVDQDAYTWTSYYNEYKIVDYNCIPSPVADEHGCMIHEIYYNSIIPPPGFPAAVLDPASGTYRAPYNCELCWTP